MPGKATQIYCSVAGLKKLYTFATFYKTFQGKGCYMSKSV